MNNKETTIEKNGNELLLTRSFNAPRDLVWEAWTKPEYVAQWWGPDGFTITTHEMEIKPSGIWRFVMHGPDGRDYPNKIKFTEVKKPERMTYHHMDDGEAEPVSFAVTVTFEAVGEETNLTMLMKFSSAEELDRVEKEYGAIEGGKQTLGRLAVVLESLLAK